jgi:hypothetical protein
MDSYFAQEVDYFLAGSIKTTNTRSFQLAIRLPWFSDEESHILISYLERLRGLPVKIKLAIDQPYRVQYPSFIKMIRSNLLDFTHAREGLSEQHDIVLHVRRGDIGNQRPISGHDNRWLDNKYYVRCLNWLDRKGYDLEKVVLISEGVKEDFNEFSRFNIIWRLNTSTAEAFDIMVNCKVLITSKSSFSYYPALLTRGLVLYPDNFWHSYPNSDNYINTKEVL